MISPILLDNVELVYFCKDDDFVQVIWRRILKSIDKSTFLRYNKREL